MNRPRLPSKIISPRPLDSFALCEGGLIDGSRRAAQPYSQLLVAGGIIQKIGQPGDFPLPQGFPRVDCSDKWIIPGLVDMEVDVGDGSYLHRFLYAGVTAVRDASDRPLAHLKKLAEEVDSGKRFGPRLVYSGPAVGSKSLRPRSAREATETVRRIKEAGAHFLRILVGEVEVQVARAALREAARLRFPVYVGRGRGRPALTGREMLESGVQAFEDAGFMLLEEALQLAPKTKTLSEGTVALDFLERMLGRLGKSRTFLIVTGDAVASADGKARPASRLREEFLSLAHQSGVRLFFGSGCRAGRDFLAKRWLKGTHRVLPLVLSWAHRHIKGFSNKELIQAASVEPARALGLPGGRGLLAPGKPADLLILQHQWGYGTKSPLEEFDTLYELAGVVKEGRFLIGGHLARTTRGRIAQKMPAGTVDVSGPWAIRGGALLDGGGGPPLREAVILIQGKRIVEVGKEGILRLPAGVPVLEARGRYIVPGITDMHIHAYGATSHLPWFLLVGITTVRDLGCGADLPVELFERTAREIASGRRFGPRLLYSGLYLDFDSVKVARNWARRLLKHGVCCFKAYGRKLTPAVLRAIIKIGEEHRLPVVCHLTFFNSNLWKEGATPADLVRWGIKNVEHEGTWFLEYFYQKYNRPKSFAPSTPQGQELDELVSLLKEHEVWITHDSAGFMDWNDPKGYYGWRKQRMPEIRRRFKQAGLRMLGSTDHMGVRSHFYEDSLAETLELLHRTTGWSRQHLFDVVTRAPWEFLGKSQEGGTIAPGKIADLVILGRQSPLENLFALTDAEVVIQEGRIVIGGHELNSAR